MTLTQAERDAIQACKRAILDRRAAKLDTTGRYHWADLDREIQDIQDRIRRIEAGTERQKLATARPTAYRPFFKTQER